MNRKNISLVTVFISAFFITGCSIKSKTEKKNLSVLIMGDLLISRGVEKCIKHHGPAYPFEGIQQELKKYDCVFANLETSITDSSDVFIDKMWSFKLKPDNAGHIKQLKLDVVSIANNHILDYGLQGLTDTVNYLRKSRVLFCGAGKNLARARRPAILRAKRKSLIFLAYNERPPGAFFAEEKKPGTAKLDLHHIKEDISKYKGNDCIILVSLHWGIELNEYPRKSQIHVAHKIIDFGADVIIGHHPHVPQGIEIYKGKPIFYSLGNAVCGFYNPGYRDNIFAALYFNNDWLSYIEIISVNGINEETGFRPVILKGTRAVDNLKYLRSISQQFKTRIIIRQNRGIINLNRIIQKN